MSEGSGFQLNSIQLGGKPVYDAPAGGRATNVFTMYTGASRVGMGRFLMLAADYNTIQQANQGGTTTLVMNGQPGPGLSFTVILAGAIPYVTSPSGAGASQGSATRDVTGSPMVEVTVLDYRIQLTDPITDAINVQQQGFPYSGSDPLYYTTTTNSGTAWEWSDVCTQLNIDPDIPSPVPSSWKPRNLIYDNVAESKVIDDVAGQLYLVTGFSDDSYETTDFYNPGSSTGGQSGSDSGNTSLFEQASKYTIEGGTWQRNPYRMPNKIGVTFKVFNNDDPGDPYGNNLSADPTSGNNTRTYEIDVNQTGSSGSQNFTMPLVYGNYVAIMGGGSITNSSELSDVANDIGARAYTYMQATMSERKYAGIWPFVPDGYVRGIQWVSNKDGATTTIRLNDDRDFSPIGEAFRAVDTISNQLTVGLGIVNSSASPQGTRFIWNLPPDGFWAQIDGNTASGTMGSGGSSSNKWQYSWHAVQYTTEGNWQTLPGGSSGGSGSSGVPAYNAREANNTSSGIQGNSIDTADLLPNQNILPVRGNPVVWMRTVVTCNPSGGSGSGSGSGSAAGEINYVFEYENAVGPCAPGSGGS